MFANCFYIIVLPCLFSGAILPTPVWTQEYEIEDTESFQSTQGIKGARKCGPNTLGNVTAAFVTGCDVAPCPFKPTEGIHIFIEGIFDKDYETVNAYFGAKFSGVNFVAARVDACKQIVDGQKCPFKKGRKYLFGLELPRNNLGANFQRFGDFLSIVDIRAPSTKDRLCAAIPSIMIK